MPMNKFSGPIDTPKSTERDDGSLAPTGGTLPAGASGKGDKNPNREK